MGMAEGPVVTVSRSVRLLFVLKAVGGAEITQAGFETFGETWLLGVRLRRTRYLWVPWSEVAGVRRNPASESSVLVVPVRPGYFLQPVREQGAIRVRPRVNADGYLVTNWGTPQDATHFFDSCRKHLDASA